MRGRTSSVERSTSNVQWEGELRTANPKTERQTPNGGRRTPRSGASAKFTPQGGAPKTERRTAMRSHVKYAFAGRPRFQAAPLHPEGEDRGRTMKHEGPTRRSRPFAANLAEREGFEPSVHLRVRRFSKPVLSTTQPPLRVWVARLPTCQLACRDLPWGEVNTLPEIDGLSTRFGDNLRTTRANPCRPRHGVTRRGGSSGRVRPACGSTSGHSP